jgi:hypothetical protein
LENLLNALEDDGATETINRVIAGLSDDHEFTDAAAATVAAALGSAPALAFGP